MAEYILQEASLALPDVFKDRTMNLFTLSDNGASEFTFVISRASAKNEDKVHDAATRLVRELEITVPDFRLESSQMTSVDGHLSLQRAKEGQYLLFEKRGKPLSIAPVPDSHPLRYALWTTSSDKSHHLLSQLSVCRQVSGSDQLNTPDRIRGYLMAQRAE